MAARACLVGCALLAVTPLAVTPVMAAPSSTPAPAPAPHRLPTPAIAPGPRTFVALAGRPAPVRVAWAPVPGASRYRVRWLDAGTEIASDLPATTTVFERAEPRAGQHELTIVAIDDAGVEGVPAQLALEVVPVAAHIPGAAGAEPPSDGPRAAFAVGVRFSSPGLACRLGTGAPAPDVVATAAGATILHCGGDPGQPTVELPIVIAPVIVTGTPAPIRRGHPTRIHVTVASPATLGDRLEVEAIGDVELGAIERVRGGLAVDVTAAEDGAPEASLVIRAGAVELGRVRVPIIDAPPPVTVAPPQPAWFALDVGGYVGALTVPQTMDDALLLGEPIDPDDSLSSGPLAGVRIGLFPTRRVGVEVETALATPSYLGRLGIGALLVTRGQLAARVAEEGRFGLRALLGGDVLALLSSGGTSQPDVAGGVHWGAAFSVETRRNVSVRFQALHMITVGRDAGYAHCLEVSIGVVTRWGRRDRWK